MKYTKYKLIAFVVCSLMILSSFSGIEAFATSEPPETNPEIIDVEVPAIWYPVDKDTNEVLEHLNPIPTIPSMYPRSEVAKLNDAGVYQIDYMGVPKPEPPNTWTANHFMYTANLFFTDRFHRIVAQARDERNFDEETSAVRKLEYGGFTDEAPLNSETGKYTGLHGMTKTDYRPGETMKLYIATETEDVSLSEATFEEHVLDLVYDMDDPDAREALYENVLEVKFNDFDNWAQTTTLDGKSDQEGLIERLSTIYLYKYDSPDSTVGEFIKDGQNYKDFATNSFDGLEAGKYEVVFPIYWNRNVPEYMSAPDAFSRNRYQYDDTIHFTMNLKFSAIDITVTKEWEGPALEEVTINLLADGEKVDSSILSASNDWSQVFEGVPVRSNGETIEYTIEEDMLPAYETKITGTPEDGFLVTNTKIESPGGNGDNGNGDNGDNDGNGGNGGNGGTVIIPDVDVPDILIQDHIAYIQGYPENLVKPEGNVSREEVAAVFFRLLEPSYKESIRETKSDFNDVSPSRWSTKHIGTLAKGSMIQGYPDGSFKPGNPITRAELATIASRFDELTPSSSNKFTDINDHWAKEYINSSAQKGWVKGYPDGSFKPDQYITRAEFVTLVNNVLQRRVHAENILPEARQFPDLEKGKWYYEAMQEAINSHHYERLEDTYEKWTELYEPTIEM